jgi:hypothetical protein
MRRMLYSAAMATALVIGLGLFWWNSGSAQEQPTPAAEKPAAGPKAAVRLPITQVVLFQSGVGYFLREGEVEGEGRADLGFAIDNMNDMLKSLVLQDLGGGRISTVGYDSPDPIDRTLQSFALDLTTNPSFGQLLNQARGEKVEVTLAAANTAHPSTMAGVLVGLETQRGPNGQGEIELLNLLCAEGLRNIPLAQVARVRFLNPTLDTDFRRALDLVAQSRDGQKKVVSLGFAGEGKRKVRVGYVVESPLWKTSYRLVIGKDGKPMLQGWAQVENRGDEDWSKVRVALIADRPISFEMDLYQPLYVPRPRVEPALFRTLRPPVYSPTLTGLGPRWSGLQLGFNMGMQMNMGGNFNMGMQMNMGGNLNMGMQMNIGGQIHPMPVPDLSGLMAYSYQNRYQRAPAWSPPQMQLGQQPTEGQTATDPSTRLTYEELRKRRAEAAAEARQLGNQLTTIDPWEGNPEAATAGDLGNFFKYEIDDKITLGRQKSAMLPILNKPIDGTKVSIYSPRIHLRQPMLGLRLKNDTGNVLMQGPLTVFDDGSYAGDARIFDWQPNEERLIAYGVDLAMEVRSEYQDRPSNAWWVEVNDNSLVAHYRVQQERTYTLQNRSSQDRLVVLEHPRRPDWKPIRPTPLAVTETSRRFEVAVPAHKHANFAIVEEEARTSTCNAAGTTAPGRDEVRQHFESLNGVKFTLTRKTLPEELVGVRCEGGAVKLDFRAREVLTYRAANQGREERRITLQHRLRKGWSFVNDEAKPAPAIDSRVFELHLPVDAEGKCQVVEERVVTRPASALHSGVAIRLALEEDGTEATIGTRLLGDEITSVQIDKGIACLVVREREEFAYELTNAGVKPRWINVTHRAREGWQIDDNREKAQRGDRLRILIVPAEPQKTARQEAVETRVVVRRISVKDLDEKLHRALVNSPTASAAVKEALRAVAAKQAELAGYHGDQADAQAQRRVIDEDQKRLRDNLERVPATSAAYKRYLEKFDSQETEIERLQERIKTLEGKIRAAEKALAEFVKELDAK